MKTITILMMTAFLMVGCNKEKKANKDFGEEIQGYYDVSGDVISSNLNYQYSAGDELTIKESVIEAPESNLNYTVENVSLINIEGIEVDMSIHGDKTIFTWSNKKTTLLRK